MNHQLPVTPYELGFADGAEGKLFLPEAYFVSRKSMREYAQGYQAARPCQDAAQMAGYTTFVSKKVK